VEIMKKKSVQVQFVEEKNELGSIWIERLIERLLLEQLDLPIKHQAIILSNKYKGKGDIDV
jgi:hypothetical protein